MQSPLVSCKCLHRPRRPLLGLVLVCVLASSRLSAQPILTSPADGAQVEMPPTFSWTPGNGNLFLFYSLFYYDVPGAYTGYAPIRFWLAGTSLPMSTSCWDLLGNQKPHYWVVLALNTTTWQLEVSAPSSFTIPACGSLPGTIIDVSTAAELVAAVESTGPGDTVRLAPGTYSPPSHNVGTYGYANLLVPAGVTVAGQGATINVANPPAGVGIYTEEGATLRDLKIVPQGVGAVIFAFGGNTLCSVTIQGNATLNDGYGVYFTPLEAGHHDFRIIDSTLTCSSCSNATGLYADDCNSPGAATLDIKILDSAFSGWGEGVWYFSGAAACGGTTVVEAACDQFSGNVYDIYECTSSECFDHCGGL